MLALMGLSAPGAPHRSEALEAYFDASQRWKTPVYYSDQDPTFRPHMRCGYREGSVAQLLACISRVVPPEDMPVVRRAVSEVDQWLAPRWEKATPGMFGALLGLERLVAQPRMVRLRTQLRRFTRIPADVSLPLHVILVMYSPEIRFGGLYQGGYLLAMAGSDVAMRAAAGTLYHELAHYYIERSPAKRAFERRFGFHGDVGIVASAHWNETLASAFDALAEGTFTIRFTESESLYSDPSIDSLGHALARHWKERPDLTMGPALADTLVALSRQAWPRTRWRLRDLMMDTVLYATAPNLPERFHEGVYPFGRSQWYVGDAPMRSPPEVLRSAVSVVFLTKAECTQGSPWLAQVGLDRAYLEALLLRGPAWRIWTRFDGRRALVVLGRDEATLLSATRELLRTETPAAPLVGAAAIPLRGTKSLPD